MFDFFNDLFGEIKKTSYRYQVDSGKRIVLQGYMNLLYTSSERVIAKLYEGEIDISGSDLYIQEIGSDTLIVNGNITDISTKKGGQYEKK